MSDPIYTVQLVDLVHFEAEEGVFRTTWRCVESEGSRMIAEERIGGMSVGGGGHESDQVSFIQGTKCTDISTPKVTGV